MSNPRRFGRTETPVQCLEAIEIAMLEGQDRGNQQYGGAETPVVPLEEFISDASNPFSNLALVEALRLRLESLGKPIDVRDPNWSKIVTQEIDRMSLEGFVPPSV